MLLLYLYSLFAVPKVSSIKEGISKAAYRQVIYNWIVGMLITAALRIQAINPI